MKQTFLDVILYCLILHIHMLHFEEINDRQMVAMASFVNVFDFFNMK